MIIKSMSRKSKSFWQLYDYLIRDKTNLSFTKNTYSNSRDKKWLIKEFLDNYKYIENSRWKVSLYHEVISLEKNSLSVEKQKEILIKLSSEYLELRAKRHLAVWVVHEDKKDNIHLHLMISSNELEGNKRVRISKAEFAKIQSSLESMKNEFTELWKSNLYGDKKELTKQTQKEQEIKHKRKSLTKKELIKKELQRTFRISTSLSYFHNHLKNLSYEIYKKWNTIGVIVENRKYRLKTMWLDKEYEAFINKLEKIDQRELKRAKVKNERKFRRGRERSR